MHHSQGYKITDAISIMTSSLQQQGAHLADDIHNHIFEEWFYILIPIKIQWFILFPFDNKLALFQVMDSH